MVFWKIDDFINTFWLHLTFRVLSNWVFSFAMSVKYCFLHWILFDFWFIFLIFSSFRYQHSKAALELAEIRRALNSLQTSGPVGQASITERTGVYKHQNLPLPPIPIKKSDLIYQPPSVVSCRYAIWRLLKVSCFCDQISGYTIEIHIFEKFGGYLVFGS